MTAEAIALERDLQNRAHELRAAAVRLWPDRDDGIVLSELLSVLGQLRSAERALKAVTLDDAGELVSELVI
jgi:hypothetical protein